MLIGTLSRLSGLSRDTIRYYEKIGLLLLPKSARRENGYKDYPEETLKTLKEILRYKDLGFTLEEIRELLVWNDMGVLDVHKMLKVVELKITGLDETIEKLHEIKMRLGKEQEMLLRRKTGKVIGLPEMKIAA